LSDKGPTGLISTQFSGVRGKKFFSIFLVIVVAQFIDLTIGTLSDLFVDFAVSPLGVGLFVTIAVIYGIGQYLILKSVKATIGQSEGERYRTTANLITNAVTIIQYVLLGVMASIVLQIVLASQYYTGLLAIGATISYGLAATLTGLLAYWFFSWFRRNRALVVLLYGLAAATISVNAINTILYFDIAILGTKPLVTTPESEVFFSDITGLVADIQAISFNGYFILTWAGTILLLRHNIQRIGRAKFWLLVTAPMVFFMSFYIGFYESINASPDPLSEEELSAILLPIMVILFSAEAAIFLFGLGFRSVAKSISQTNKVRDYMMITAYGFILFFTAAAATISAAGYPPFGIANVLLVGPYSYLILIGLYDSAISIAEDTKLRQSIRTSTRNELKILDKIGIGQVQREVETKVLATTKANAEILAKESGIQPSLTDEEIHEILNQAVLEIRRAKEGENRR
jgi:hypothetical protein